jgi:hypothetical protein
LRPETLARKQEEMRARLSNPQAVTQATQAVRGRKVSIARLALREALAAARKAKQRKRIWTRSNHRLRNEKRGWHAALRRLAREINVEGKALHAEMVAAKDALKNTRVALGEITIGERVGKALSRGYELGIEAEKQRKAQNEN